jgi:hypothetical protein
MFLLPTGSAIPCTTSAGFHSPCLLFSQFVFRNVSNSPSFCFFLFYFQLFSPLPVSASPVSISRCLYFPLFQLSSVYNFSPILLYPVSTGLHQTLLLQHGEIVITSFPSCPVPTGNTIITSYIYCFEKRAVQYNTIRF